MLKDTSEVTINRTIHMRYQNCASYYGMVPFFM